MNDLKYVQLEAGAFLSDIDFQTMTTRQRGVFISLILYLYANGGSLPSTPQALLKLCNATEDDFEEDWKVLQKKFQESKGVLTHKRVTSELAKAKEYYTKRRLAGQKGGLAKASKAIAQPEAKLVPKGKVREGKVSKEKKESKEKYKEFVFLTQEEYKKLIDNYTEPVIKKKIEDLNNYIGSQGKKYKSHYHTILNWLRRDNILPKDQVGQQPEEPPNFYDLNKHVVPAKEFAPGQSPRELHFKDKAKKDAVKIAEREARKSNDGTP